MVLDARESEQNCQRDAVPNKGTYFHTSLKEDMEVRPQTPKMKCLQLLLGCGCPTRSVGEGRTHLAVLNAGSCRIHTGAHDLQFAKLFIFRGNKLTNHQLVRALVI